MIIFVFGEFGASAFAINIYMCTTYLSLNVHGLVFPSFQMRRGTIVTTIFIGSRISIPRISNHPPSIKDFFGYSHPYNQHSSFCFGKKNEIHIMQPNILLDVCSKKPTCVWLSTLPC